MLPKRHRLSKRAFTLILRKTKKKIFLPHMTILVGFLVEKDAPIQWGVLISAKQRNKSSIRLHAFRRHTYRFIADYLSSKHFATYHGIGMIIIPRHSFFTPHNHEHAKKVRDKVINTLSQLSP